LTTAYPQYALESYELDVIDYLVKPIPFDRFLKAVNKAKELFDLKNKPETPNLPTQLSIIENTPIQPETPTDYFFVKTDSRYEKIFLKDILYVEALQNYVTIQCDKEKITTYVTLKIIEDYLPPQQFLKVQKSFIVALSKIDGIEGMELHIGKHRIPISRQLKEEVMEVIFKGKLVSRGK
jgi:DNA-binding LytR/AlgR family response regulator